ncbi:MAG: AraC family transcriptional regulator [Clostridia bacterium]|nr:AraC family transcriptional regulator [Clostridia bacterium]
MNQPSQTAFYESIRDNNSKQKTVSVLGPTVYPAHFHKSPEITYVFNGTCHATINNGKYIAFKDEILFAPDYYPHSFATSLNVVRYSVIPKTESSNIPQFILKEQCFPCLLTNKKFNREKILPVIKELYDTENNSQLTETMKTTLIQGFISIIYGRLLEGYESQMISRNKQVNILIDILAYIDANYKEKLTLENISASFGYNKYYFSKIFNSYMNESLTNYINRIRIQNFILAYAKSEEKNILNIAFAVGFDSMPSFYRAFQKYTNCTPKDYFRPTNA